MGFLDQAKHYQNMASKFTIDNSPLILTAVGTLGVVTTGVLAFKGGFKAAQILEEHESGLRIKRAAGEEMPTLSMAEKLALTWRCYLPACGVGLGTLGVVVAANQIGARRSAALAAAFAISEKAGFEYKEKVKELIGDKKEATVTEAVATDRVNNNPPTGDNTIVVTHAGDQIFQDSWSGRYFRSNMDQVQRAVNDLNHTLNVSGHATLTEFYDQLGLAKTRESDEIGWNSDQLLDVYYVPVMHDNGQQAVMAIEYRVVPSRDYFRTH